MPGPVPAAAPGTRRQTELESMGSPRVLVVDDTSSMRTEIRHLLEDAGLTVVGEGGDGAEGLMLARELPGRRGCDGRPHADPGRDRGDRLHHPRAAQHPGDRVQRLRRRQASPMPPGPPGRAASSPRVPRRRRSPTPSATPSAEAEARPTSGFVLDPGCCDRIELLDWIDRLSGFCWPAVDGEEPHGGVAHRPAGGWDLAGEVWLRACAELDRLQAGNPLLDAVIDEVDGRRIRVGDRWLHDFASCNYLGLDLDREVIEGIPAYLDRWGTHPGWSRMLGSPVLYEQIEAELRSCSALRTPYCCPPSPISTPPSFRSWPAAAPSCWTPGPTRRSTTAR